jgi:hypothetical protein
MRHLLVRQSYNLWIVLALACACEAVWLIFVNLGFFMDTIQYLRYANELVGHDMTYQFNAIIGHDQDATAIARRTIGYPLVLLLAGVPFTGSLIGVIILQAAMAIAMLLLAYKTLEPFGRRVAFITTLVLIASLEPFTYSKAMLTEQTFKFLLLLLIYLTSRAYGRPSQPLLAGIAGVNVLLTLVRPQASLVAILVFAMLAIAHPRRFLSMAGYSLVVITSVGFCSLGAALYIASYAPLELPENLQRTETTFRGQLATLLLYHLYVSRSGGTAVLAEKGTERAALRSVMQAYASQYPQEWTTLPPNHYFGVFAGNPSGWVDAVFHSPNPYYFNMIKVAVSTLGKSKDPEQKSAADHLIRRVLVEAYRGEPQLILSFVRRYVLGSATSSGAQISWSQYYTAGRSQFSAANGPASKEILDLVKMYISDFPSYPPARWRNYPGGTDQLVNDVFSQQPAEENFWFFWEVVDRLKGRLESGPLFFNSLWEFGDIYYHKTLLSLDKLAEMLIGMPSNYALGKRAYDDAGTFMLTTSMIDLPERMQDEIKSGLQPARFNRVLSNSPHYRSYVKWYTVLWLIMRDILNLTIVATMLFCFRAGTGWIAALIGLIVLYNDMVVALVTDTYIRYIQATIPMSIVLAGLSINSCARALRAKWLLAGSGANSHDYLAPNTKLR